MPISDEALQSEKNRFIAVKGEATAGQALAALGALGGQPWWHLVVRLDDGLWGVMRFSELSAPMSTRGQSLSLKSLAELRPAPAVECDSMETKAAQTLCRKTPGQVLIVTVKGAPTGILVEGVRRSAARGAPGDLVRPSSSLNQLGGKHVKLKDYGSILLGSSKK
jgi:hypothetical protein